MPPKPLGTSTLFFAVSALCLCGCAEELGPEKMVTTRVSGVVLEAGRPVTGGWIEFIPVDGTVGKMRSAPLNKDGTFEADKVPVGVNRIGLVGSPVKMPGWRRFFDSLNSVIRKPIPAQPVSGLKIDLYEELARFQSEMPR